MRTRKSYTQTRRDTLAPLPILEFSTRSLPITQLTLPQKAQQGLEKANITIVAQLLRQLEGKGIPGIGPKTRRTIIQQLQDLDSQVS